MAVAENAHLSVIYDWYVLERQSHFCSTKCIDSMTLKRQNVFQNYDRKDKDSFTSRLVIFKLQLQVLKFNDTSWVGACQNWHGDSFIKPGKPKFWERQFFSSIVTFKYIFHISLLNNLFINFIELKNIY